MAKLDIVTFLGLIGEQNCSVQFIDNCAAAMNYTKKKGTAITFLTDAIGVEELVAGAATKKQGIIVWVDRQAAKEIVESWPSRKDALSAASVPAAGGKE